MWLSAPGWIGALLTPGGYAATRAEILEAAWNLVHQDGLGALSMRDLGARVGMRAQSLYAYFPSKHAIYDAMFGAANQDLLTLMTNLPRLPDPRQALRLRARTFLDFCVQDPVRYQLLFQRTIAGFVPSPESYAPAVAALDTTRAALTASGITDPRALDIWTALNAGLAAQQTSNEPGGDRWLRLVDETTDMYLARFAPTNRKRGTR